MLRLFAAIFPPTEIAAALLDELREYTVPEHRQVPADQVHLTMQFIGDTPGNQLDATIESVQRAAAGLTRFVLKPEFFITLPDDDLARLVAVETDSPPTLLEIKRRLVTRLARTKRERNRGFRPHFTLCRFRFPVKLGEPLKEPTEAPAFEVDHIALMQSILKPSGAEYMRVATAELQ